jgi:hypothetical protein
MFPRLLLLRIIRDKSIFWTLFTGVLSISVALLIVSLDYRNEYHMHFALSSIIAFIFSGLMISLYSGSRMIIRDLRKDRFKYPVRIGILRGSIREDDRFPCQFRGGPITENNLTEHQWQTRLQESDHYEVRVISVEDIDDRFSIILNPFGETYPEEDIATRMSFHRIIKYMEEGGILLNTCGMAFYYMWDSNTGRSHVTGEPLETFVIHDSVLIPIQLGGQTSVSHSWMKDNFGIRTTIGIERENLTVYQSAVDVERVGNIADVGGTNIIQEFRAALYGPSLIPLLRAYITEDSYQAECYPLAVCRVGLGYLVVSGFTPNSVGWVEKISVTLDRICDRIMQLGTIQ